jgi:DNA-3-methyladenine glycosylase I
MITSPRRPGDDRRMMDVTRCPWVDLSKPLYVDYHDREWGVPVHDDPRMFEFLTLEAVQAGLSWYTVLARRENYRAALDGFDPARVASYGEADLARLMSDAGLIRNAAKMRAIVWNAGRFLDTAAEFGSFDTYIWRFVGGRTISNEIRSASDYRATSPESERLSADLRRRGFRFAGPVICYAHMQAVGMVDDHHVDCFRKVVRH